PIANHPSWPERPAGSTMFWSLCRMKNGIGSRTPTAAMVAFTSTGVNAFGACPGVMAFASSNNKMGVSCAPANDGVNGMPRRISTAVTIRRARSRRFMIRPLLPLLKQSVVCRAAVVVLIDPRDQVIQRGHGHASRQRRGVPCDDLVGDCQHLRDG